ncbi:tetratricopeptide repeat protein [Flavobacterium sp. CYK-55]|uniref:tetratricopeptide repeat protein n=1 Tax=Flavobacterium sp. CYK-55 TaxID=2835529 RepID=UPI00293D3B57|nr:tetratricopeptide repeat protein [Flavobacterium sp. CYK-55]
MFDFITSDSFNNITSNEETVLASEETTEVTFQEAEIEIPQETEVKLEQRDNTIEQSLLDSIKEAEEAQIETKVTEQITSEILEPIVEEIESEQQEITEEIREEKLDIGKPLNFTIGETHSFQEWLQLSSLKPIQRTENPEPEPPASEIDFEKQKKNELIDKFIEANPKIPKIKPDAPLPTVFYESSNADASALMTETLARVYLEQKKYQKAIQAYEILILKYPEKSSFFADRILDIKNLQQNNK